MKNYENSADVPWDGYLNFITTVTIGNGVTSIGDTAFEKCTKLTIFSHSGNTAENYAKAKSFPFFALISLTGAAVTAPAQTWTGAALTPVPTVVRAARP